MLKLPTEYIAALEGVLRKKYPTRTIALSREDDHERATTEVLDAVAHSVEKISDGLTKERNAFLSSHYLGSTSMREAYLVYYMTTNLLKLWPPLRELAILGFFENRTSIRSLDLGSGTGTAVWSLLLFLEREFKNVSLDFLMTDVLEQNLTNAREFCTQLQTQLASDRVGKAEYRALDLGKLAELKSLVRENGSFDLITMMNVLNELPEQGDEALIEQLLDGLSADGAVILIEPGVRELSRRALRFRDRLSAAGAFVSAPCVRSAACPALIDATDWCHTNVAWERPKFIEYIDNRTGRLRLSLKYTYCTFGKVDRNVADEFMDGRDFYKSARVVSEAFHERGRVRAFFCNERGRDQYMMNLRDRSDKNFGMTEIERYDLVRLDGAEVRAHDVKMPKDATINRLIDSSGARIVDNSAFGVTKFEKS